MSGAGNASSGLDAYAEFVSGASEVVANGAASAVSAAAVRLGLVMLVVVLLLGACFWFLRALAR